jgi:hypothetical protein
VVGVKDLAETTVVMRFLVASATQALICSAASAAFSWKSRARTSALYVPTTASR